MFDFKVIKQSKKSKARLGMLNTSHGVIETPAFVPVATQAVIKTLEIRQVLETESQLLIANTFHLHLKPGEQIVKNGGGLHKFMNWPKPIMTDSGGFQVFSLGFGRDMQVGKILKNKEARKGIKSVIPGDQPQSVRIREDGVEFRSPLSGEKLFMGPRESIKIQEMLGADIIFAFDECTPPLITEKYAKEAMDRTHRWAKVCLDVKKSDQALFGIIQGSKFKKLRQTSARFINSLEFEGFGIGGDLGESKESTKKILRWIIPELNDKKPRHLLGIGHPEDMEIIIKEGIDTFDCIAPTHYARRGVAFISQTKGDQTNKGKLDLEKKVFLKDKKPIDPKCSCYVCQTYTRSYISHLMRAKEITAYSLISFHNLYFFNQYVYKIRQNIKLGKM